MARKYTVSREKFKRLYWARFVLAQILGALSFGALLVALRFVSDNVWPRPVLTGSVLFFFVGAFVCVGSWLWYAARTEYRKNAFILIRDDDCYFVTRKIKPAGRHTHVHFFVYRVTGVTGVSADKRSITVYGDVAMNRRDQARPKELVSEKKYRSVQMPNFFDAECVAALKALVGASGLI